MRVLCVLLVLSFNVPLIAQVGVQQANLGQRIRAAAEAAHGQVSVSCALPGTNLDCDLGAHAHSPMQSVFKLPLAIAALHEVDQGKLRLDQPIRFLPSDRFEKKTYSPLQDKYPDANVDIPLEELLKAAVSLSDNVAADMVLRVIGGPKMVDDYMHQIDIREFHLEDGEHGLARDWKAQYRNWMSASAAVDLLRRLNNHSPLSRESNSLLLQWMAGASTGPNRLKAGLPSGTTLMHKTGTSGTRDGVTPATNDMGLITLPDGRRLAIAVFVTYSKADEAQRDAVIANIARLVYDSLMH